MNANRTKEHQEYYASTVSSLRHQSESFAAKARIEFWMGNLAEGFRLLEESMSAKDTELLTVRYNKPWDAIRDHPRFVELIKKAPFPPSH
jgi:hypothetical protein